MSTGAKPHDSPALNPVQKGMAGALAAALRLLDRSVPMSRKPFLRPELLRPRLDSRRYGSVHYGVFFPSLPEPHRYLNVMTLIGMTGTVGFDNDHLVSGNPRQVATLLTSTAADSAYHYRAYDVADECEFAEDGSLLRFGDALTITGEYPEYRVQLHYGELEFDVVVSTTDTVSYFVRNVVYDHLSLLSRYRGTLRYRGEVTEVAGLCTFEYAACFTAHTLLHRPMPAAFKVPIDFFTYQIVNLDESTQLLLTKVTLGGRPGFTGMHVRRTDGSADIHVKDVRFEVVEHQTEEAVAPDGHRMRLPARLSWRVADAGKALLELDGIVDSPWRYGHGKGYVSHYRYSGRFEGRPVEGRGYIEYVDCQAH